MDSSKSFLHTTKQIHHHRSYIVIAFQEIIPSVFVGCHYSNCCKAKNIGFAVVHENTTRLSILFLAVTTGLVPVLLFHCRPCPSFPSWCLKVPNISAVLNLNFFEVTVGLSGSVQGHLYFKDTASITFLKFMSNASTN